LWIALVITLVVVIALLVGTFVTLRMVVGDDVPSTGEPVRLEHVHGLGVDPADGTLYAGTNYGLIRIGEDGTATRVAGRVQDFMGFTVVGPEHYLASGHPGADQDGPANLGLIESTDGGQSWTSVSLEGEADFHVLEARHDLVYGYNAGSIMVSEDGVIWKKRGSLPLADFAVSRPTPTHSSLQLNKAPRSAPTVADRSHRSQPLRCYNWSAGPMTRCSGASPRTGRPTSAKTRANRGSRGQTLRASRRR